jgi:hypothetical protein
MPAWTGLPKLTYILLFSLVDYALPTATAQAAW